MIYADAHGDPAAIAVTAYTLLLLVVGLTHRTRRRRR